jgi:hypothetical protein
MDSENPNSKKMLHVSLGSSGWSLGFGSWNFLPYSNKKVNAFFTQNSLPSHLRTPFTGRTSVSHGEI